MSRGKDGNSRHSVRPDRPFEVRSGPPNFTGPSGPDPPDMYLKRKLCLQVTISQLRGFFVIFGPHSVQNDHFLTHEKLLFMNFKAQKF